MSDEYINLDVTSDLEGKDLAELGRSSFSDDYKQIVFQIWYNNGKPPAHRLYSLIPAPETNYGQKPAASTLVRWIAAFEEQAKVLDASVREAINRSLIESKVEMLKRHVEVAKEGQKIALEFLREAQLTPAAAVRLLIDCIAIERSSMGIPEALEKIVNLTDEQLIEELKKELENSTIESLEANDA